MKYKYLVAIALVGFVAAGCNSTKNYSENQETQNQTENGTQTQEQGQDQTPDTATDTNETGGGVPDSEQGGRFSGEEDINVVAQPEVIEIRITSSGFSPANVTIQKGDYVQFTNTDSARHWPASDPHPQHTDLSAFDAKKGLNTGENYRYQFNTAGTFEYHDHMNPGLKGTIIVK